MTLNNFLAHLDTANKKDHWLILGPGGGGCVHTLTINPHHPDTLVVSCDMTAGYITHNGGQSWREFNLKSRQFAYAFDPVNPDVLYVGSSGLFRSEDNGAHWSLVFPRPDLVTGEIRRRDDEARHTFTSTDNWPGGVIHAILIDPDQNKHIFIAIKKKGAFKIFLTRNRGVNWVQLAEFEATDVHRLALADQKLFVFTDRSVFSISNKNDISLIEPPKNIRRICHASTGTNPQTGKQIFYLSSGDDIWRSSDLGETWQKSISGLQTYSPDDLPAFSQVSACACDARCIYLIAEKFPEITESGQRVERYGILKSEDEGQSWQWVVRADDESDPSNREFGWAERDYGARWGDIKGEEQISPKGRFAWDVVASPVDPQVCFTMDFSTIYVTRNGGATWEQLVTHIYEDGSVSSRGIDVLSTYGVFFDPFDAAHIALAITDVGMFHSRNGGRTWLHALNGVPREWVNTCYWMVFDPQVPGRAWSVWAAMHDLPRKKMFHDEFLHKYRGGICKSNDGLANWQVSSAGLPEQAIPTHIVLDASSPVERRTLYAAVFNGGVYKSVDGGTNWMLKNNGIDARNPFAWRLALLPDGTLYLAVVRNQLDGREFPGALYKSMDGAEHWQPVTLPADVDYPNEISFDDTGRLYLCCWPQSMDGQQLGGGVYASDDDGGSWHCIFDPTVHAYALTVDPVNHSTLYLATFHGAVYRSDDRGASWHPLAGMDFQWNHRVIPDPHHKGMIYLATFGSSVWYGPVDDQ